MAATIIDGKAIAARVRARSRARCRAVSGAAAARRAWPPCSSARTRPPPSTSAASSAPVPRSACVPFDERLPADASFEQVAADAREPERGPRGQRHPAAAARARPPRRPGADGADRPEQGRRRAHPRQRRAALPRPARPASVHAARRAASCWPSVGASSSEGAEAVVVGRSNLFGKPMAQLLLAANATVTVCHSRTRDLREVCARADVLIAAVGPPAPDRARVRQARRDRDRRGHEPPHPRAGRQQERARRRRGLRARSPRSPRRSPRCPAGSAR